MNVEDLIADEEMVITVSREGYVKRTEVDTYRAQRRGGRGLQGMGTNTHWITLEGKTLSHHVIQCMLHRHQ